MAHLTKACEDVNILQRMTPSANTNFNKPMGEH